MVLTNSRSIPKHYFCVSKRTYRETCNKTHYVIPPRDPLCRQLRVYACLGCYYGKIDVSREQPQCLSRHTTSNFHPELPSGDRDSRAPDDTRSQDEKQASPHLRIEIPPIGSVDDGSSNRRTRKRGKRHDGAHHAEAGAHLPRVGGQAGQGGRVQALGSTVGQAEEERKDVHASTVVHADPGKDQAAEDQRVEDVEIDGAEVAVC